MSEREKVIACGAFVCGMAIGISLWVLTYHITLTIGWK